MYILYTIFNQLMNAITKIFYEILSKKIELILYIKFRTNIISLYSIWSHVNCLYIKKKFFSCWNNTLISICNGYISVNIYFFFFFFFLIFILFCLFLTNICYSIMMLNFLYLFSKIK